MPILYHFQEAIRLSGLSRSQVRNYLHLYESHFSRHACPTNGQAPMFTPDDVRFLAFLNKVWEAEEPQTDVAPQVGRGELAAYTYTPPAVEIVAGQGEDFEFASPPPQVYHFGSMLDVVTQASRAGHQRETGYLQENHQLYQRIEQLQRRLGQVEAQLLRLKAGEGQQAPAASPWLSRPEWTRLPAWGDAWRQSVLTSGRSLSRYGRLAGAVAMLAIAVASLLLASLVW